MAKKDKIKWDVSAGAGANARRRLPDLVRTYYEKGRQAACCEAASEALHAFRLRSKRLRYTVELFRSCYGPGLERWVAELKEIQDHLGAISDCATTAQLCRDALPKESLERKRLETYVDRRIARKLKAFQRYWRDEFDKPREARRWERYFGRAK